MNRDYAELTRRDKRSLIFHLLYVLESYEYDIDLQKIVTNLNTAYDLDIPLNAEEIVIATEIISKREELDQVYEPLLSNWRIERLGVCTRLVLRYAIWELKYTELSSTIIINEAIELAKCFCEKDAHKFINGILDEVLKITM